MAKSKIDEVREKEKELRTGVKGWWRGLNPAIKWGTLAAVLIAIIVIAAVR